MKSKQIVSSAKRRAILNSGNQQQNQFFQQNSPNNFNRYGGTGFSNYNQKISLDSEAMVSSQKKRDILNAGNRLQNRFYQENSEDFDGPTIENRTDKELADYVVELENTLSSACGIGETSQSEKKEATASESQGASCGGCCCCCNCSGSGEGKGDSASGSPDGSGVANGTGETGESEEPGMVRIAGKLAYTDENGIPVGFVDETPEYVPGYNPNGCSFDCTPKKFKQQI